MPTCLILGAGPGVSFSVAKEFLARGFKIILCARNQAKLIELASQLDGEVVCHQLDVSDSEAVKLAITELQQKEGQIDVLLYNAFSPSPGRLTRLESDAFLTTLKVNVQGALVAVQALLPSMKERDSGALFFTGGGLAIKPAHNLGALSVGKAALRAMVACLSGELRGTKIHAATVTICGMVKENTPFAPDLIAAEFLRLYDQPPEEYESEVIFE